MGRMGTFPFGVYTMTPKQKLVLDFIQAFFKVKGYAPSYSEIASALDMKAKSNIHRIIHKLKEQGLIQLRPHCIRSMELVDKSVKTVTKL
ncbi:LexA repressor, DNA-binding domain containing protein [uncultured Caudovirales phage]|uniref:LexA repressor, DNA-binding domain containing protein n=1 Tax=uncultured Caudovirales phage TaxID=2100421 RepID=A0A6J5LSF1_9CAUD|nr:LexA repressor, DNA-binding domain containing protein [uncultured Caudovirales phage]